jgi:iron-sulfur cluster repair protein YtfE (RIC family)
MAVRKDSTNRRRVRNEHVHLRELLESVRQTLAARQGSPPTIAALFDELSRHVLEHFEHEETGGFFSAALELAPRLTSRAGELLQEHAEFRGRLSAMRQLAMPAEATEDWWRNMRESFERFFNAFRRHETAENRLLQEAYSDDIGAED